MNRKPNQHERDALKNVWSCTNDKDCKNDNPLSRPQIMLVEFPSPSVLRNILVQHRFSSCINTGVKNNQYVNHRAYNIRFLKYQSISDAAKWTNTTAAAMID